jgi:hypothetical protein
VALSRIQTQRHLPPEGWTGSGWKEPLTSMNGVEAAEPVGGCPRTVPPGSAAVTPVT